MDKIIEQAKQQLELKFPKHEFAWTSIRHNRVFGLCPNHYETVPSFNVYIDEQGVVRYHCFGCGFSGVLDELSQEALSVVDYEHQLTIDVHREFYDNFGPIVVADESIVKQASLAFLTSRKITDEDLSTFEIKICDTPGKKYFGYIGIPFFNDKKVIFFTARRVIGTGPKYLFPAVKKTERVCYYLNDFESTIVIVEGIFDAINVYKAGFSVLLLFGKFLSKKQLEFLRQNEFKEVKVFLDKDAVNDGDALVKSLRKNGFNSDLYVPDKKDPGEMELDKIKMILNGENRVLNRISGFLKGRR